MSQLTVVAHITARSDSIEHVKSALQALIAPTLQEPGCINYDLHQDNDNPAHFMFYENWQSRELWQQHMASAHVSGLPEATGDGIESVSLHEMTPTKA